MAEPTTAAPFWAVPLGQPGERWRPLTAADLTPAYLAPWEAHPLYDYIAGLDEAPSAERLHHLMFERRLICGWCREAPGGPPIFAYVSDYTMLARIGVFVADPAADPEAYLPVWRAGIALLTDHLFAHRPELDALYCEVPRVVSEARHEALLLSGWEPHGGDPSRMPVRATYRLGRDVHALYGGA